MSRPKPWLVRFSEKEAMSDLLAAARACMSEICEHDAADCMCPGNQMTPLAFAEWIEDEHRKSGRTAHESTMGREIARASARRRHDSGRLEAAPA